MKNKILLMALGKVALVAIVAAAVFFFMERQGDAGSKPVVEEAVTPAAASDTPTKKELSADEMLSLPHEYDIVFGDEDAPVQIVEYASLSCPHCAHFYEYIHSTLKPKYIDTGKARLVFRHFPHNLQGLRATQLVQCIGAAQGEEARYKMLDTLFKTQSKWSSVLSESTLIENLGKVAKIAGMDKAAFDKCMNDEAMVRAISDYTFKSSQTLKIQGVPYVFVNKKPFRQSNEALEELIEKIAAEAEAK